MEVIESHTPMLKGFTERISFVSHLSPTDSRKVGSLRSQMVASSQIGTCQESGLGSRREVIGISAGAVTGNVIGQTFGGNGHTTIGLITYSCQYG